MENLKTVALYELESFADVTTTYAVKDTQKKGAVENPNASLQFVVKKISLLI